MVRFPYETDNTMEMHPATRPSEVNKQGKPFFIAVVKIYFQRSV
jgi:hypothetical protein